MLLWVHNLRFGGGGGVGYGYRPRVEDPNSKHHDPKEKPSPAVRVSAQSDDEEAIIALILASTT